MKKSQISTEYLIVFGIAFLIIIVGVFAFMKFAKTGALTKNECTLVNPRFKCEGFGEDTTTSSIIVPARYYSGTSDTTTNICFCNNPANPCLRMELTNIDKEPIYIIKATLEQYPNQKYDGTTSYYLKIGGEEKGTICLQDNTGNSFLREKDAKINSDFTIEYRVKDSTLSQYVKGHIRGVFP